MFRPPKKTTGVHFRHIAGLVSRRNVWGKQMEMRSGRRLSGWAHSHTCYVVRQALLLLCSVPSLRSFIH